MEIYGFISDRNVPAEFEPLFEAFQQNKTVASITLMGGSINRDNRDKDWTITDVVAVGYYPKSGQTFSKETGNYEWVDFVAAMPDDFYMSWVLSFTL